MDVDVLFFDVGNTLIYPDPPVGEVYARALREEGFEADPDEVERSFEESWSTLRQQQADGTLEYGMTRDDALDWWRLVVRESCRPFGEPEDFEAFLHRLWEYFATGDAWGLYDDVLPTVRDLRRRGKRLGLISNWDVRLEQILRDLGLWARFDCVTISAAVGVEKPDPEIFRHALRGCDCPAERALHVGDSEVDDVAGARGIGMRALWLRRDAESDGPGVITGLSGVLDALDRSGA